MTRRIDVVHAIAVYDGREHRGDVVELVNGQYEALDADGTRIGLYDDRPTAARAVIAGAQARSR